MERVCIQCGITFETQRSDALYHNDACRMKYKRLHKENGKPEFAGANFLNNLKEPVVVKPEPPKPLPVQPGKKSDSKCTDTEYLANWQMLLQKIKMIDLSGENRYIKEEAYKQVREEAGHITCLTYNQKDGIRGRVITRLQWLANPDLASKDFTGTERMQKAKSNSRYKQTSIPDA